eukprot:COSAG02_NODE_1095_length_14602_cov_33.808867_7_plen_74_part_00
MSGSAEAEWCAHVLQEEDQVGLAAGVWAGSSSSEQRCRQERHRSLDPDRDTYVRRSARPSTRRRGNRNASSRV